MADHQAAVEVMEIFDMIFSAIKRWLFGDHNYGHVQPDGKRVYIETPPEEKPMYTYTPEANNVYNAEMLKPNYKPKPYASYTRKHKPRYESRPVVAPVIISAPSRYRDDNDSSPSYSAPSYTPDSTPSYQGGSSGGGGSDSSWSSSSDSGSSGGDSGSSGGGDSGGGGGGGGD